MNTIFTFILINSDTFGNLCFRVPFMAKALDSVKKFLEDDNITIIKMLSGSEEDLDFVTDYIPLEKRHCVML